MVNESGGALSLPVAMPHVSTVASTVLPFQRRVSEGVSLGGAGGGGDVAVLGAQARIRNVQDARTEAALQVRHASEGLDKADELLAKIQDNLNQIVKQYPPLAQDSPQRVAYLNAITGLRKQLEALAFPPERKQSGGENRLEGVGVDWQKNVPPSPVVPSQMDVAVSELDPRMATDEQIGQAVTEVNEARSKVAESRAQMWQGVVDFVGKLDAERAAVQANEIRNFAVLSSGRASGLGLSDRLVSEL